MKMEILNPQPKIRTFTGRMIDPFDPDPEMIDLVDIAHSLSQICRFNGHTPCFYSVAEHCLLVSSLLEDHSDKLAAMLHDASEAYLTDLTRPVKYRMEKYLDVEFNLMVVISRKFGFQYPLSVAVKDADDQALAHEWANIVLGGQYPTMMPLQAKGVFLRQLDILMNPVIKAAR